MMAYPTSLAALFASLHAQRELVGELVRRDFLGRYKGAYLGFVWALLQPIFMLVLYTLFFTVAFKARWETGGQESTVDFALVFFAGMIVHALLADCLNRAPTIIVGQPNYVKKIVFPLELLPCVVVCTALLQYGISLVLLGIFCWLSGLTPSLQALWVPLATLPLVVFSLGITLLLASLGVFLRDLSQMMSVVTTVLLFLSPVFYPASTLPPRYRVLLWCNPLTYPIEQLRDLLLWGKGMHWGDWCLHLLISVVVCQAGFWWFQKSRRGFADVL